MHKSQFNPIYNNELYNLAKFVVEENFNHHNADSNEDLRNEITAVYKEEASLNDSKIFFSKDFSNSITGSIRVVRWNKKDILPIEKLFSIHPYQVIENQNIDIWHIGRFAVKKDRSGFKTFKALMTSAINEVCKNENSVALAECDAKLLKTLILLGIECTTLSESIEYLGSETIPVLISYAGLKSFLDKNKNLLHEGLTTVQKGAILKKTA
ncbi:hypothetical protein [Chryseobacterium sp. SIMBA_038]|uniref:hypothetical protein n=1 Tax=Chryseobacterium sp. SIMBA_038 TaxID=3085780 RepID=UPI00397AE33A